MSLTSAQQAAVTARGNVLVVAGAGTGKTSTLVERCLNCLLEEQPRTSLDEILMVTFTDAAAAEMRQRIRARLEQKLAKDPEDPHWQEQLALFEAAHIGTLHSFCLQLVRQHFYELELDPQLSVLPEEEARLLADETLEALLQKHYAGRGSTAEAVQHLIQAQGHGWDQPIRTLVLRLHHYTQTLPDPAGWLEGQLKQFTSREPAAWQDWLLQAVSDWCQRWQATVQDLAADNDIAAACAAALRSLNRNPTRAQAAEALAKIRATAQDCPHGKKTVWLKPLGTFLDEAQFLASLACLSGKMDPLAEDWAWVRTQMTTLLHLTQEFTQAFTQAKRELGMVDFHDLEQHALRLLWDPKANQPTKTAGQWRKRLRFVFVDEYQDINAAQDKIIEALSRQGKQANRFLVGDVKQSIYRFRLANPHIFQNYVDSWGDGQGLVIPLVENFRSREGVLEFINSLFEAVMRREVGGVPYDDQARLRFGAAEQRQPLSRATNATPCAELLLRVKGPNEALEADEETDSALAEVRDLEEADKEARLVALRLRELKSQQHAIWDEKLQQFRPVEWRDMAILLRSPSRKTESYAKEFSRLNVPLQVARGGFYQSLEVSDLLSLLQLLDNPLQDLPVLAVLHSPLVGLTLNELAAIRLTITHTHFWTALLRWEEGRKAEGEMQAAETRGGNGDLKGESETLRKVNLFLERFARWRRLARQVSLTRCLEAVLSETHYAEWLLTQPRGEQRHANVQRLVALAQQFDQFQRQGLFRFLRFIEAQQMADTEPGVAPVSEDNAVRLMSIHQSKGLEFPVVVVADLGKPFNALDLHSDIILDEVYGLCPQIKPPHTGKRYPSLPHWLARQRQLRELLGEELRLLYVAMTRARDTLILSGAVSPAKFNTLWKHQAQSDLAAVLAARSYADWLGLWFAQNTAAEQAGALQGENHCLRWAIQDDTQLILNPGDTTGTAAAPNESLLDGDPELWGMLQQRLAWAYAFAAATRQPAKTSVTVLRRRAAAVADDATAHLLGAESPQFEAADSRTKPGTQGHSRGPGKVSGADIGNAHHTFLQHVALDHTGSSEALKQEARRLQDKGVLSAQEIGLLNFKGLAAFWKSALGRKVRSNAQFVHRELVFTSRFSPKDLVQFTGESVDAYLEEEFIIVQGVADLAVVLPQEIWVIDFKTDGVAPSELAGKAKAYEPQLKLYAQALAQIYRRPVTECWMYFLSRQAAVAVELHSYRVT